VDAGFVETADWLGDKRVFVAGLPMSSIEPFRKSKNVAVIGW
jgi:hypothetical protein